MAPTTGKGGGLIAAPGYRFLASSALLILLGWLLSWSWLWWLGLVGLAFFGYFFRDPERDIPPGPETVVAPADGKVVFVEDLREDRFFQGPTRRVAIFMNVFDVHVNRAPMAGAVTEQVHRPGAFKAAFRHEAGMQNEQLASLLTGEGGRRALVVQIAGLLARRIVPYVKPGDDLAKGQRFGMICFGSRVDVYLPPEVEIRVRVGDRVKAGSSIIALWR
jgi:phosphatidylserine decarboxylase